MSRVECRAPVPEEAADVCAMLSTIVQSSFPMFPDEAMQSYLAPWTEEKVSERLRKGNDVLIGAYVDGKLAGITSGTPHEGGVGTIIWLLVDSSFRGHGVGRALFDAACDAYRKMGAHKMKLTAPSEAAKQFYERCGMQTEGFHPKHWYGADFSAMGFMLK